MLKFLDLLLKMEPIFISLWLEMVVQKRFILLFQLSDNRKEAF